MGWTALVLLMVVGVVGGVLQRLWGERSPQPLLEGNDPADTHSFPADFTSWDVDRQMDYLEQHGLLDVDGAGAAQPEGIAMWVIEDVDMGAFEALTAGGRPELSERLARVMTVTDAGAELTEEHRWVGQHIAEHGLSYEGLTEAQASLVDQWVLLASDAGALGEHIGARGGAFTSKRLLEIWRSVLGDDAGLLDRLRWGARPDGTPPAPTADGYHPAYALCSAAETARLLAAMSALDASAPSDTQEERDELRTVLTRAVAGGRGLLATNED